MKSPDAVGRRWRTTSGGEACPSRTAPPRVVTRYRWNASSASLLFQAEDGIRDIGVTGVQTCALPILHDELAATMICVTHDQIEAMAMADKIVVLQSGIVEQAGTPLELYHHPRNLFVAGFIGSPKMNFLPATITSIADSAVTIQLAGGASLVVPVRPGRQTIGDKVTLGVRPEHMRLSADG